MPHTPNDNVLSQRLNCPYDRLGSYNSGDRLCQICIAEVANVHVWLATSILVSAERSGLTRASVTS